MSWFNVWTGIKNKTCRYLLQRYLGQFLEERLNLEQLKVDLYNGKATVENVSLNVEALNNLFETQGWSVEVISGRIGLLTVTVPWNALMTNNSYIEISDAVISVRPVQRQNNGTSMLESMWSSASNSMQLAEECMKQKDDETEDISEIDTKSIPGLEKFAETIDSVLNRIKASFTNTTLRLEYRSSDNSKAIYLCININKLMYENETGCEKLWKETHVDNPHQDNINCRATTSTDSNGSDENIYLMPMFARHNVSVTGLRLCTEELYIRSHYAHYDADASKLGAIPLLEIKEHLNIRIKMKQSENINGPKVVINTEAGPTYALLTPRQVHLLLKLLEAFQDDTRDTQEGKDIAASVLNDNDMYRTAPATNEMVDIGNWIDSDTLTATKDTLEYIRFDHAQKSSKKYSPPSSSLSSSTTITALSKLQRKASSSEYSGEILNFSAKIGSFVGIILHDDILVESYTNAESPLNKSSEQDMIGFANTFFESSQQLADNSGDSITLANGKNHIFIRISPIVSEGTQHRIKHLLLTKIKIIAQNVDLYEMLSGASSQLILFDRAETLTGPDIGINIKSDTTTTIVDITLQKCQIEFDISIYDRLSAIMGPSPFAAFSSFNTQYSMKQEVAKSTVTTNLTSTNLEVKLRFPIFDARPIHDPNRIPWWQQNVRSDYLLISFNCVSMKYVSTVFELLAKDLNVHYVEKDITTKVCLLKTNFVTNQAIGADSVKITITIPDGCYWAKFKKNFLDGNFYGHNPKANASSDKCRLPFSSKHVCRESDTLHNKQDNVESETYLLPGETEEINEFCSSAMRSSKVQVQINVPNVEIILDSKHLYEVIYNRFNTDLFMWQPSSPILNSYASHGSENKQSICNISTSSRSRCRNFNECNLSDSEESDTYTGQIINLKDISMTESIYFSIHDPDKSDEVLRDEPIMPTSHCSIEIGIQRGSLGLIAPVRDKENQISSEGFGKFLFTVNELKIVSVNGYNGNKNLCYLCLQLGDVKMDHCGMATDMSTQFSDENATGVEQFMRSTLYKTPKGLSKSNQTNIKEREMLSLVIETKRIIEQRIKRLRVTTGIQQTTLRYHSMISNQFWLNQLIDFLDVPDYPIQGYEPFAIITEMQLHLWNCAIDYRPNNFDYRAVVELGSFTISSNVIPSITGCNLRFIMEDFILSIAPYERSRDVSPRNEKTRVDSKYLVPVMDIGFFDISLKLNENSTGKYPNLDLRCSVYDAHLRTCSDSGKALAQLIEHLAEDTVERQYTTNSNFQQSDLDDDKDSLPMDDEPADENLLQREQWQQERVNLMMAEAVQETVTLIVSPSTSKNPESPGHGIEPFYFPDEQNLVAVDAQSDDHSDISDFLNFEHDVLSASYSARESNADVLPQVKTDLGDVNTDVRYKAQRCKPTEDEYCIISDDEKQLMLQYGFREIKVTEEPIRIVDNHFCLPSNKFDLLKPPADFPMPISRYTLCEMTFTWHLYGGRDFICSTTDNNAKSEINHLRMSDAYKHGVSYSKSDNTIDGANKPKDLNWKTIGGVQRNHEVIVEIQLTKVRFSHEIYPTFTTQASRQVLVVHDLEIRDRLQSSDINKFLYHPSTKNQSFKTPQHMLIIKALHIRPNPKLTTSEECSLRISLLPMRLHIDQDTLSFLADYFTNIGNNIKEHQIVDQELPVEAQEPVMDVDISDVGDKLHARNLVSTNLDLLENEVLKEDTGTKEESKSNLLGQTEKPKETEKSTPIYFREVVFSPDVPIRFDYHGRRVELSRGPIAGLLMGLGQLHCSEIRLKRIVHRRGFLGIEKLVTYLCKEWLKDIKRNQLPKILKGVGPTYSFVQFFQGVIDLFRLPIEQYQRDGRIIRGLQLGAQSFTARTALAALEITSRVIQLLQFTAETAFDMVSSGPSVARIRKQRKDKRKRPQRPMDVREGVTNAYLIVKEGINDSAATLIETAVAEHDQKGYTGAVGAVMRQIPQLVVCPAVLATQATTNILGGVKSSLVPDAKVEAREKWKNEND